MDRPVAWLSLDGGDSHLPVFLSYLIAAMQQVDERIGRTVQMTLEMTETPPPSSLMASLLNDIESASSPFIVVLDDFHFIRDERVHESLRLLLDRLPSQMHLAILSRERPPLALPRMLARD